MWGFSEHDVQTFLTQRKGRQKTAIIKIGDERFSVVLVKGKLVVPSRVKHNPFGTLFKDMAKFKEFLPQVDGECRIPDVIVRALPKQKRELVVIELKNEDATEKDVAQLRRYMNLVRFYLDHNIEDITRLLGVKRGYKVKGILLARSVSQIVWLTSFSPGEGTPPDIQLVAYELRSHDKRRDIENIRYMDFSKIYREDFQKLAKQYRKTKRQPSLRPQQPATTPTPSPEPAGEPEPEPPAANLFQ